MVVKTQSNGLENTGLHVGASNARRFFPKHNAFIELHIGHLRIECRLAPDFWVDQPEIHDARLSAWLESKHLHARPNRSSVPLVLHPSGTNSFTLEAAS